MTLSDKTQEPVIVGFQEGLTPFRIVVCFHSAHNVCLTAFHKG